MAVVLGELRAGSVDAYACCCFVLIPLPPRQKKAKKEKKKKKKKEKEKKKHQTKQDNNIEQNKEIPRGASVEDKWGAGWGNCREGVVTHSRTTRFYSIEDSPSTLVTSSPPRLHPKQPGLAARARSWSNEPEHHWRRIFCAKAAARKLRSRLRANMRLRAALLRESDGEARRARRSLGLSPDRGRRLLVQSLSPALRPLVALAAPNVLQPL